MAAVGCHAGGVKDGILHISRMVARGRSSGSLIGLSLLWRMVAGWFAQAQWSQFVP